MAEADFGFAPGLHAGIVGPDSIVDAFRREYAPCEIRERTGRALEFVFGRLGVSGADADDGSVWFGGRHKSVAWHVRVSSTTADPRVSIELVGAPRAFGRSLVQGYIVEPMISIVSAERGLALVPSAAVADERGVTLILGRSGAGKSTLMARLAATGRDVLGDDQIFVDAAGRCTAFPRRLRFYPDIETTVPEAYARLPRDLQRRLRARRLMAAATRGYVRPSLGVDRSAIGGRWVPGPLPIARIVLMERGEHAGEMQDGSASVDDATVWAAGLLAAQRDRLEFGRDPGWRARLLAATTSEEQILRTAFTGRAITRLVVPPGRPASEAVAAVAERLGFVV
jgi:hypothetical protein